MMKYNQARDMIPRTNYCGRSVLISSDIIGEWDALSTLVNCQTQLRGAPDIIVMLGDTSDWLISKL